MRRKREEERVWVGREEYCNNLRDVMREKLGVKSKEWRCLNGCWYRMVGKAYIAFLGCTR